MTSGLYGTIFYAFASFKGAALFLRTTRVGTRCQVQYPQTRLVMRRFERVVALPDSKLVISLSRINTLTVAGLPGEMWFSAADVRLDCRIRSMRVSVHRRANQ